MDDLTRQCFIGDSNGNIHFLKINPDNKCQLITTLSGHTGNKNSKQKLILNNCFRRCSNTFMGS